MHEPMYEPVAATDTQLCHTTGRLMAGLVAVVLITSVAVGDTQPTAEDLIQQLGAESFERREQAEQLLQQRGADALDRLRGFANDSDLEIRFRARRLIGRIEHQQQWRLLERFLTDYDPELAQQLPGWSTYVELVGDDLPARQLFVEMFAAEPEIMSALHRPTLPLILEQRSAELQPASNRHPTSMSVPAASTGVLLLVSLEPQAQATTSTHTLINAQVIEPPFRRSAAASTNPPLLRLLSAWISRATDVAPATRMNIGAKFELPAAVEPARELLETEVHGSQLQYAAFTIARLGGADEVASLEKLLDNETVLSERQRGDEPPFTCQVRDVALASLIHLIGKHPREFGFRELRPNSNSLYALNTAGFDSDDVRATAFRKWELWRSVQRYDTRDVAEIAVAGFRL